MIISSFPYMQILYLTTHLTRNKHFISFSEVQVTKKCYIIDTMFPQLVVSTKWPSGRTVSSMASSGLNGRQIGRMVSVNSMN